jgi:sigma-B regulation protein RsbU (phosphoserine phosphatase)
MDAALRRIGMPRLFMGLQLLRFKDHTLEVCSAGMPPVLLYCASEDSIESITTKSPPIGGSFAFAYETVSRRIGPGDVLVAMTDGLPECFNENNDSLGHEKISAAFRSSVHLDPEDIVRRFMHMADAWMTGSDRRRRDDMSFLVVKAVEDEIGLRREAVSSVMGAEARGDDRPDMVKDDCNSYLLP